MEREHKYIADVGSDRLKEEIDKIKFSPLIPETCDTCQYMVKCDSNALIEETLLDRTKCSSYKYKSTKSNE